LETTRTTLIIERGYRRFGFSITLCFGLLDRAFQANARPPAAHTTITSTTKTAQGKLGTSLSGTLVEPQNQPEPSKLNPRCMRRPWLHTVDQKNEGCNITRFADCRRATFLSLLLLRLHGVLYPRSRVHGKATMLAADPSGGYLKIVLWCDRSLPWRFLMFFCHLDELFDFSDHALCILF